MGGQWRLSSHSFGFWPDGKIISILSLGLVFLRIGTNRFSIGILKNDCNENRPVLIPFFISGCRCFR
jgi:hypothetical protein